MQKETYPLMLAAYKIQQVLKEAPVILGGEGLNFFLDSFKQQGWMGDHGMEKWPARKKGGKWGKVSRPNRALLIDSGRLRRSVRIIRTGEMEVIYGSDVPYARAHNEGLRLGIIQQVKSFNRKTKLGKTSTVKAHTRRINQRIPKRQFMGSSTYLTKRLQRILTAEFNRTLKNI